MKRLFFSIWFILPVLFTGADLFAQPWAGSTTTTSPIYRTDNVGIGITAPNQKLHIHNGALQLTGTVPGYGGPMVLFGSANTNGSGAEQWGIEYLPPAHSPRPGLNFWKPFGSPFYGNYYLFLSDNSYVGINTDNPTARLTVNGNMLIGDPGSVNINTNYKLFVETGILTEKVKVAIKNTTNWADFVFDEEYKLRTIGEVEVYIKENKHLPEIPSSEEVVRDGIDLGTMDAKLLQKIEEQMLYIIELEKRIKILEQH